MYVSRRFEKKNIFRGKIPDSGRETSFLYNTCVLDCALLGSTLTWVSILWYIAISSSIYVQGITNTPTNFSYGTNFTRPSRPTFRYEDAFRMDVVVYSINTGLSAVLLRNIVGNSNPDLQLRIQYHFRHS